MAAPDHGQAPSEEVAGRPAYDVPFVEESSHGHVVALLREHAQPGIVVDVGCGYAPHAETLRESGFAYVGLDADVDAVAALTARGFTAVVADADDVGELIAALDGAIGKQSTPGEGSEKISAVLALDVLEHLVSPHVTLGALADWARRRDTPLVGLSLPNVSHQDVALKLLAGRFDLTPTGLLDHTHLRFFTDESVCALTERVGLGEVARHDVRSPKSDQDWPERHPMLSDGALLGSYLRRVRRRADDHGTTFQFVRLFAPVDDADGLGDPSLLAERPPVPTRSITVLVRPGTDDADVASLRRDVELQAAGSTELRLLEVTDDLVEVLADVPTAYVGFVGGGDRLGAEWAASVLRVGDRYTAAVIRSGPADGEEWASSFSPFDHYVEDATPGVAVAFPTAFLRDLSRVVPRDPASIDTHALLLEASAVCGVVDSGAGTVVAFPGWAKSAEAVDAVVEQLADGALLAPVGAAREIARLRRAEIDLSTAHEELERRRAEIDGLNAELARRPVRVVRRAANLANRVLRRG